MAERRLSAFIESRFAPAGTQQATQAFDKLAEEMDSTAKAGKKVKQTTGDAGDGLGKLKGDAFDLTGKLTSLAGATAAFGFAARKAFDLAEEGAAIEQTGESFELLLQKVGAAPDLLSQLRNASLGTVDDMTLMKATTTLLAGAQGELATSLANATPRLLEIAKAANKLNPELGDTKLLYDSLALGIKRASPEVLDNLGLTIKIGDANAKYAKEIGKTVEQLTAEEQKMAILNATVDAGDVLIQQAGGTAASATDDFTGLTTSIKNLADAVKRDASPAVGDAARGLTGYSNALLSSVNAERELKLAVERGIITKQESNDLINKATWTSYTFEEALAEVRDRENELGREAEKANPTLTEQNVILGENANVANIAAINMGDWEERVRAAKEAADDAAAAEDILNGVYDTAIEKLGESNIALGKKLELEEQLRIASGELTTEQILMDEAIGYLTKQVELGNIKMDDYLSYLARLRDGSLDAADAVRQIGAAIGGLPTFKEIQIKIDQQGWVPGPGWTLPEPSGGTSSGWGDDPVKGNRRHSGGPIAAGIPYVVKPDEVLLQSGRPGMVVPGGQGGGQVIEGDTYYITNTDAGSARLTMAMIAERKRERLNASMGG